MQSTALTYARYMFFTNERDLIIDETNYKRMFISQKRFEKIYGVTNDELLKKYNYEKFKKKHINF